MNTCNSEGNCVECLDDNGCNENEPYCSSDGLCVSCLNDSYCIDPTKPYCSSLGTCV